MEKIKNIKLKDFVDIIFRYSDDELLVTDENFNIILQNYKFNFCSSTFNFSQLISEIGGTKAMEKMYSMKYSDEKALSITFFAEKIPIRVNIYKIFDCSENINGYFISIKNISSEVLYNLQKENFISALAHDLKTPVIAQINTLKMLLKSEKYSDNELLTELYNSCLFLNRITDNLLAKYKDNFNSPDSSGSYCDMVSIINHSVDNLKYSLSQKHQIIEFKISSKINMISAIKSEMELLVDNLLFNALDNSRENGRIVVSLENKRNGIKLTVKDFGFGAEEDEINSIFDDYVNCANKYQKLAHNMSLKLVRQIVLAYGGLMKVKSKTDKGMAVEIILPVSYFNKKSDFIERMPVLLK